MGKANVQIEPLVFPHETESQELGVLSNHHLQESAENRCKLRRVSSWVSANKMKILSSVLEEDVLGITYSLEKYIESWQKQNELKGWGGGVGTSLLLQTHNKEQQDR